MYIPADTLDDLLAKVFRRLLVSSNHISPSKGSATEIPGVLLRLGNPRARLSRTDKRGILFSCLGEWLWYLTGSNSLKFIEYYLPGYGKFSDDGKTIYGGYGPRIFGKGEHDQIRRVIGLLGRKPDSRQAVVQIFDGRDIIESHEDVPCTCTLQFMIRNKRLHMLTSMRSNDAYIGLPHDIFAFTMIQELVARSVGVELGQYKHFVGSLHLYSSDRKNAAEYLEEGWQSRVPMPPMPSGDPWNSVGVLLAQERKLRQGRTVDIDGLALDPYWADLVRILKIFKLTKSRDGAGRLQSVSRRMSSEVYAPYLKKKLAKTTSLTGQLEIFKNLPA